MDLETVTKLGNTMILITTIYDKFFVNVVKFKIKTGSRKYPKCRYHNGHWKCNGASPGNVGWWTVTT